MAVDIDYLEKLANISSPIIVLVLAVYAEWSFFPKLKKQKRLENLSQNAKEALRQVSELEAEMATLHSLINKNEESTLHSDAQQKILIKLLNLRDALFFLQKDEDLIPIPLIDILEEKIKRLNNILKRKPNGLPKSFASIDFLYELDFLNEEDEPFKNLRELLLKIYNFESKNMKNQNYYYLLGFVVTALLSYFYMTSSHCTSPSTIIILNGPSAAGKSSIQEAFIRTQEKPWIKIGIDNFFVGVLSNYNIMGEYKPVNAADMIMKGVPSTTAEGKPVFTLEVGTAGEKIIHGMNHAIKAYADAGNNIIVDYIAYKPEWLEELVKVLSGHKVIMVKVDLPLEILEQREAARATSPQGHARSHYDTVHKHNIAYDMSVDTSKQSAQEIAEQIVKFVEK